MCYLRAFEPSTSSSTTCLDLLWGVTVCTVPCECIHTPYFDLFFHIVLCCCLMLNCFKLLFPPHQSTLHTRYWYRKNKLSQFHKYIKNKKLKKVHCISTKYLAEVPLQPQVFFVWCDKLWLINIWQLSNICLLTIFTSQALSGFSRHFQVLQKYLIGFKSRLWLGHSTTFTALCRVTLAVCLGSLSCLEGKPSAIWGFWMLWTGFSLSNLNIWVH